MYGPNYEKMERFVTHICDGDVVHVMVLTRDDLIFHRKNIPWFAVESQDIRFTIADIYQSHFVIFVDYEAGAYKVLKDYFHSERPSGFIDIDAELTVNETEICTCECHRDGLGIRHCMPCCDVTYDKYIDHHGDIDMIRWAQAKRRAYAYARSMEKR